MKQYRRKLALALLWLAHKADPDYISGLLPQMTPPQTPDSSPTEQ